MELVIGQTYNERYIALDRKAYRRPVILRKVHYDLAHTHVAVGAVVSPVESPERTFVVSPSRLEPLD